MIKTIKRIKSQSKHETRAKYKMVEIEEEYQSVPELTINA